MGLKIFDLWGPEICQLNLWKSRVWGCHRFLGQAESITLLWTISLCSSFAMDHEVGQIGSDQNWWISSNMITEMGCWSPMTSICSYSSKGWLNHQITLMAAETRSDWPTIGMQDGNKSTGDIISNHQNLITFQTNQTKSKQIKIEKMSKVWFPSNSSNSNFHFRWISFPMWQRWRRCWSRSLWDRRRPASTWSLQLDLHSVASVGAPWCHGDFMGILR